jgi:hypothetical protein
VTSTRTTGTTTGTTGAARTTLGEDRDGQGEHGAEAGCRHKDALHRFSPSHLQSGTFRFDDWILPPYRCRLMSAEKAFGNAV